MTLWRLTDLNRAGYVTGRRMRDDGKGKGSNECTLKEGGRQIIETRSNFVIPLKSFGFNGSSEGWSQQN